MIAVSNLLNLPVQSVYPCMNGSKHVAFTTLNNLFRPPFADPEKGSLTIMWTSTSMPEKNSFTISQRKSKREWTPNHFVPLVNEKPKRVHVNNTVPLAQETHPATQQSINSYKSPNRFEGLEIEETEHVENVQTLVQPTMKNVQRNQKIKTKNSTNRLQALENKVIVNSSNF